MASNLIIWTAPPFPQSLPSIFAVTFSSPASRLRSPTPPRSTASSTPPSGRVCAGKKAASRRSHWPTSHPRPPAPRCSSNARCRSTPRTSKLSPAVERPGIHLGVWKNGGELHVWGATRTIPPLCFVVEVIEPGLLVIKHRRADPDGKFANVAVLEGDQVKIVDAEGTLASECPDFVSTLLGFDPASGSADNVLLPLALSMRAHHHGGSLLVVPHGSDAWRKSIVSVPYQVAPPFSKLRDGASKDAIDAIGGLTAVDGAVILNDRWDVLAFGAKLGRTESGPFVEQVLVREPIRGHTPVKVHASELGGTRHLSAAQFIHEQRDSLALVASQDGRFTVFGWSQRARMVHAYRVEALLL